jgi:hypothetical protein
MVNDSRELLEEGGNDSEDIFVEEACPTTSMRRTKGWLVISGAIVLVAFGGMAAVFQKDSTTPQHTKRGAKPTNLGVVPVQEEQAKACETYFNFENTLHRNLGGKGPEDGEEGVIFSGSYEHAGDPPVPLEMHFHALTTYKAPKGSNDPNKLLVFDKTPSHKLARIVMHESEETKFKVELVKAGTHEPFTVAQLAMSFFDLDGPIDQCEHLDLEKANDVVLAQDNHVNMDDSDKEQGIVRFSNEIGNAKIPKRFDQFESESERSHSIAAIFYGVSTFNVTLKTGSCGDRWFTFLGRAAVQCSKGPGGSEPPPVDISTALPPPLSTPENSQYCLFCWIHGSLSFIPPCQTEPAWWAKLCET